MKLFTKALISISLIGLIAALGLAASGPQTVINNAAPFALLSDRQLEQANVSLLAQLMGLPLTAAGVQSIVSNAAPFQTLSDRNIAVMQTYLLYQLTGAATNVPISDMAVTNLYLYSQIVNGNDNSAIFTLSGGRALYDDNGIDAIDFYYSGTPSLGYALNQSDGTIALAWDAKLLASSWFNNGQFVVTNATSGIRLSYLGCGYTNVFVQFTNTGAAGDFVSINQSNLTSGGIVGSFILLSTNYATFGNGAVGAGSTGVTNTGAAQFNYINLQYSTNCGWGGVQSNGVANSTLTLKGFEEAVQSMGNTIVQLGDATTNLGHHISITCGSAGTNAITTVSSQKIAGQTKWTNTAVYSCTMLISDGVNWQLCGSRGN